MCLGKAIGPKYAGGISGVKYGNESNSYDKAGWINLGVVEKAKDPE